MTEPIEDLLRRTLEDPRRAVPVSPSTLGAVAEVERRLRRHRLVVAAAGTAATALAAVVALTVTGGASTDVLQPTTPQLIQSASSTTTSRPTASAGLDRSPQPSPRPRTSALAVVAPEPTAVTRSGGVPGRISGRAVGPQGQPLAHLAVMTADLRQVLTRTDRTGAFRVTCVSRLLLAPYAPSPYPSNTRERSPGAGNWAWRWVDTSHACGRAITVPVHTGGAVEGTPSGNGAPGPGDRVSFVPDSGDEVQPFRNGAPTFATTVRADGTYRIEGLAAGRYRIVESYDGFEDEAAQVQVREGETVDGSYQYYVDSAVCYDQPPGNPECDPSPAPSTS